MSGFYHHCRCSDHRHPLRESERTSHSMLLPGCGGGYRPQELEHGQQAVTPLELKTQPQRQRQRPLRERRHEPGPGGFPEGAAHQVIQKDGSRPVLLVLCYFIPSGWLAYSRIQWAKIGRQLPVAAFVRCFNESEPCDFCLKSGNCEGETRMKTSKTGTF